MRPRHRLLFRQILEREFAFRRTRNSSYSLRAYARDLGFAPSSLSEILHGRIGMSSQSATRVSAALRLTTEETAEFVDSVQMTHARSEEERKRAWLKTRLRGLKHMSASESPSLCGIWKLSRRFAQGGSTPLYWNPKSDVQYFVIAKDSYEFHQSSLHRGVSVISGKFEFSDGGIETVTSKQSVVGADPAHRKPWLAAAHRLVQHTPECFQLSTPYELLGAPVCPLGESLETFWLRM